MAVADKIEVQIDTAAVDEWLAENECVRVKHGVWVDVPNGKFKAWKRKCSVCGCFRRGITPYCSECGAKMDGER